MTDLVCLTQTAGEFEATTRLVWLRPEAISHFHEYAPWRAEVGTRPRWTQIHLTNGEFIRVTETPECLAAHLGYIESNRDPLLTVEQNADLMTRYPS